MRLAIEAVTTNCSPRRVELGGRRNGLPCLPFGLAPMEAAMGSYNDEKQKAWAIFGLVPMNHACPQGNRNLNDCREAVRVKL
jgi:hypothetical protein